MPPAFGDFGKDGTPVPVCMYHPDNSLATCACQYAHDWRNQGELLEPIAPYLDERRELYSIIDKLLDLLSQ